MTLSREIKDKLQLDLSIYCECYFRQKKGSKIEKEDREESLQYYSLYIDNVCHFFDLYLDIDNDLKLFKLLDCSNSIFLCVEYIKAEKIINSYIKNLEKNKSVSIEKMEVIKNDGIKY